MADSIRAEQRTAFGKGAARKLRAAGATGRVIVASFSDAALNDFRAACPEVLTSMTERELRPLVLLSKVGLSRLARAPGQVAQVPVRGGGVTVVTPAFVRAMHARGVDERRHQVAPGRRQGLDLSQRPLDRGAVAPGADVLQPADLLALERRVAPLGGGAEDAGRGDALGADGERGREEYERCRPERSEGPTGTAKEGVWRGYPRHQGK